MATPVVNPYDMPLEDLKNAIENPTVAAPVEELEVLDEPIEVEQPRDAQGRFASPNGETEEEEIEEFEETVEKAIDLNDGSGVQLFRGVGTGATKEEALINAYEALAEELAKAQRNATSKIRELSRPQQQPQQPRQPTAAEEAELSQRLISNPSQVLREVREQAAKDAEDRIRQQQEATAREESEGNAAAIQFVQSTPDFFPCPQNQERIERYMKLYQLPKTLEGIQIAYEATKDILVQKPAQPLTPPTPPARTARSSGISTRRSAAPPAPAPGAFDQKGYEAWLAANGASDPTPFRRKF